MIEYDISDFPTILIIDANDTESSSVALVTPTEKFAHTESVRAQEVVVLVERVLKEGGFEPTQIRAICVLKRDGSLTGQRIGVSIANTLSWLSASPIIELTDLTFEQTISYLQNKKKFTIQKVAHAN